MTLEQSKKVVESSENEEESTSLKPKYFDANYYNTSTITLVTDKLNKKGEVENFEFQGEEEFLNYLKDNHIGFYSECKTKIDRLKKARKFAYENGIVSHYNDTKKIPEEYTNYLNELFPNTESTRGVGILWDNLNASGSNRPLLGNPEPTFFGWNNRAESATGVGLANFVFERIFFGGDSRYLLLGTATNIPFDGINFRNKTSSAL